MAVMTGACRFGLWFVHVMWAQTIVHRVFFSRQPGEGAVPVEVTRYLAGKARELSPLVSVTRVEQGPYHAIYQEVSDIPYGETVTYGEIAARAGTAPRVVGAAMRRNPTPIIIPCHRVVAKGGLGGFTPDQEIKVALLALEGRL
jgi:methylated-DNA-[protein]-cysteine S-methyltransferase